MWIRGENQNRVITDDSRLIALAATPDENSPLPTEPFSYLVSPLRSAPSHEIGISSHIPAFGPGNALSILHFAVRCAAINTADNVGVLR